MSGWISETSGSTSPVMRASYATRMGSAVTPKTVAPSCRNAQDRVETVGTSQNTARPALIASGMVMIYPPTSSRALRGRMSSESRGRSPSEDCKNMTTMSQRTAVPTVRFDATLYTIDKWTILRLPEKASGKLPSRGQVAVQGTINGHGFQTVVEPDGYLGHWMRIDGKLQRAAAVSAGDTATLEIEPLKDWPEPSVPQDLEAALAAAPQKIQDIWEDITPMARWEWVRWINATANSDTRKRRVEVSVSKMKSGKRRPCCFNLAACTDPNLSKSGRLIEPA